MPQNVTIDTAITYSIVNGGSRSFPILFNPQPAPTTGADGNTVYAGAATIASPFSGSTASTSVQLRVDIKNENTVIVAQFSLPQPTTLMSLVNGAGGALDPASQALLDLLWDVYANAEQSLASNTLIVLASDRCLVDLDFPNGDTYTEVDVVGGFNAFTVVNTGEMMSMASDHLTDASGTNAKALLDDAVAKVNAQFHLQGTPLEIQIPSGDPKLLLGFSSPAESTKEFSLSATLLVDRAFNNTNPATSVEVVVKNFSMRFDKNTSTSTASVATQFTVKLDNEPPLLLTGGVTVNPTNSEVSFWGELFTPTGAWEEPFGLPNVSITKLVIDVSPSESLPYFAIAGSGIFGFKAQSLDWDVALSVDPNDITQWAIKAYPPQEAPNPPPAGSAPPPVRSHPLSPIDMKFVFGVLTSPTPLLAGTVPTEAGASFLPTFSNLGIYAAAREITIGQDTYQPGLEFRGTMHLAGALPNVGQPQQGQVDNEVHVGGQLATFDDDGGFLSPMSPQISADLTLAYQLPTTAIKWACNVGAIPAPPSQNIDVSFAAMDGKTVWTCGGYTYTQTDPVTTKEDIFRSLLAEGTPAYIDLVTNYLTSNAAGLGDALRPQGIGAAAQCLQDTWQQTLGDVSGLAYSAIAVRLRDWFGATEEQAVMLLATFAPVTMRAELYSEIMFKTFGMNQDSVAIFLYNHLTQYGPRGSNSDPNYLVPGDIPNIVSMVIPGSGNAIGEVVNQLESGRLKASSIVEGAEEIIQPVKRPW